MSTPNFMDNFVASDLSLASKAAALLEEIIGNDEGLVCIYNPDGSHLTLHRGFRIAAIDGQYWTKMPSV